MHLDDVLKPDATATSFVQKDDAIQAHVTLVLCTFQSCKTRMGSADGFRYLFPMYKAPLTSRAEQIGYTFPKKAIGRGAMNPILQSCTSSGIRDRT